MASTMRFRQACLVACLLLGVGRAIAWDAPAHEIIAQIAFDRLNPKARTAVEQLAAQLPYQYRPYDAITAACWMDDLRDVNSTLPDRGRFLTWHYIDLGIEDGDPQPPLIPGSDNDHYSNVVQALQRARVVLRGGTDPYVANPAMACAMILHLVGDIHQPLHAATHYFYSHGQWRQDAGGNREEVENAPADEPRFSLHQFWDSAWRASLGPDGRVVIDPRFQELSGHDPAAVRDLARELEATPPAASADLQTDFAGWARESNQIARDFVYPRLTATESRKVCRLSSVYVDQARALARQRLVLAGWRLAGLLNATLGADHPTPPPASFPAGPPDTGL